MLYKPRFLVHVVEASTGSPTVRAFYPQATNTV